jgi:hypothetical protein
MKLNVYIVLLSTLSFSCAASKFVIHNTTNDDLNLSFYSQSPAEWKVWPVSLKANKLAVYDRGYIIKFTVDPVGN